MRIFNNYLYILLLLVVTACQTVNENRRVDVALKSTYICGITVETIEVLVDDRVFSEFNGAKLDKSSEKATNLVVAWLENNKKDIYLKNRGATVVVSG